MWFTHWSYVRTYWQPESIKNVKYRKISNLKRYYSCITGPTSLCYFSKSGPPLFPHPTKLPETSRHPTPGSPRVGDRRFSRWPPERRRSGTEWGEGRPDTRKHRVGGGDQVSPTNRGSSRGPASGRNGLNPMRWCHPSMAENECRCPCFRHINDYYNVRNDHTFREWTIAANLGHLPLWPQWQTWVFQKGLCVRNLRFFPRDGFTRGRNPNFFGNFSSRTVERLISVKNFVVVVKCSSKVFYFL